MINPGARVTHLDTARGVAVMGILVINSLSFFLSDLAIYDLTQPQPQSRLSGWVGILGELFADQKSMGLFSLLFGASYLLFLDRVRDRTAHPIRLSAWRNTLLLLIGFAHAAFWVGDILMVYALCVPILMMAGASSWRGLVVTGLLVYYLAIGAAVAAAPLADETTFAALLSGQGTSDATELLGFYVLLEIYLRALGMMLIGMGLYRSGWLLRAAHTSSARYAQVVIGAGALVSATGVIWGYHQGHTPQALMLSNIPNTLVTPLMSLAYLALIMCWDAGNNGWLLARVRSLGRMALTNYLSQTLICLTLAQMIPSDWLNRASVWLLIFAIWAVQLGATNWWLSRFRLGPAEWLWRCATYRRWQPLRR